MRRRMVVLLLLGLLAGCGQTVQSTPVPVATADPAVLAGDETFVKAVHDGRVPAFQEIQTLVEHYLSREPDPHNYGSQDAFSAAYGAWQDQGTRYNGLLVGRDVKGWQGWVVAVSETDEPPGYEVSLYADDPYLGNLSRKHQYALDVISPDVYISGLDSMQVAKLSTGLKVSIRATIQRIDMLSGQVNLKAGQIDNLGSDKDSYQAGPESTTGLDGLQVDFERTPCFGACSTYKVSVVGSGELTYVGERFVEVTGTVKSTLTQDEVRRLVYEFERSDFFNMADNYPPDTTDSSGVKLSITLGGRSKQVTHDRSSRSAPRKLYLLEQKIDEIVNSAQWVSHR